MNETVSLEQLEKMLARAEVRLSGTSNIRPRQLATEMYFRNSGAISMLERLIAVAKGSRNEE